MFQIRRELCPAAAKTECELAATYLAIRVYQLRIRPFLPYEIAFR